MRCFTSTQGRFAGFGMTLCIATLVGGAVHGAEPSGRRVPPFEVVDANGKRVGPLIQENAVQVTLVGQRYAISLRHDPEEALGVLRYSPRRLYFTTSDCTGTVYAQASEFYDALPRAIVNVKGKTVMAYLPEGTITKQLLFHSQTIPETGECEEHGYWYDMVELLPPVDISLRFAAPFRVK